MCFPPVQENWEGLRPESALSRREFREPGFWHFFCAVLAEVLRRFAETVVFPDKVANVYFFFDGSLGAWNVQTDLGWVGEMAGERTHRQQPN